MVTPLLLTDPFNTNWYHGTNTTPFTKWQCPPPNPTPADVPHSGLFFTADHGFAKNVGNSICTIKLSSNARLIVPTHGGAVSTAFRNAVIKSNPIAAYCHWLTSDSVWTAAWSTGEVMRFSWDTGNHKAALEISKALAITAANIKKIIITPVSDDVVMKQAMLCLTRGWIEQLVREAKKLGYQAIQGAEIDRWSVPNSVPVAQPWLAVMDGCVITAPAWR